jgi:type IV pilus assembly protein PilV
MNTNKHENGFTLIEVLVTMFVMTVGLLGIAGIQSTSIKDGLDNAKRSQVMWLVTELVERARANPAGQATGYNRSIDISQCATTPAKQCSDNGAGDAATNCSPNEMAAFDVWEVFCGNAETGVIANAGDSLNLSNMTMGCTGTCLDTSNMTVSISWVSKAVTDSHVLSDTQKTANKTQTISMTVRP